MYNFKDNESLYTTIKETTPPTTATVGIVGQKYLDTTTKSYYICTSVDNGVYTWERLATSNDLDKKLNISGGNITGSLKVYNRPVCTVEESADEPSPTEYGVPQIFFVRRVSDLNTKNTGIWFGDGRKLHKLAKDAEKLNLTGGTISGNLAVQGNLTVTGETTTEKQKTLDVEDNFIYTNANKVELTALLSGIAIYKNGTDIYAIAYDPATDSVKLGLGTRDAQGVFHFNTGEGSPVAVRADSADLTDNHIIVWDAANHKFIDSGKSIEDLLTLINSLQTNLTTEITDRTTEDTNLQTQITNIDTTISSYGDVVTHNINEFASAESLTTKADVNASNLTITNVTNWKNKLNVQSDIFSKTLLYSSGTSNTGNLTLSQAYNDFYKIVFNITNETGERHSFEVFTDYFMESTNNNPYNLPASHPQRPRYINIYPVSSTVLSIKGIENMTLDSIWGVCRK